MLFCAATSLRIGCGQCVGPDVILFDPAQSRPPQRRHVRPDHRLKPGITGLGNENGTDARGNILDTGSCLARMTECIGKSGSGLDFENQLWKIDAGHPGIDRAAQGNQALRFLQFVERRENQVGIAADFFDPYARIFGQVGGCVAEGLVEPLADLLIIIHNQCDS